LIFDIMAFGNGSYSSFSSITFISSWIFWAKSENMSIEDL